MFFGIGLAALAVAAGVIYRLRLAHAVGDEPAVSDDMIRQIEEGGWVEIDEPLDFEDIRDEEERFLEEEAWDEPEEW